MCDPGEDVVGVLGQIVKARSLGRQVPQKALEHPEPKQALRVSCWRLPCLLTSEAVSFHGRGMPET